MSFSTLLDFDGAVHLIVVLVFRDEYVVQRSSNELHHVDQQLHQSQYQQMLRVYQLKKYIESLIIPN